MDFKLTPEIEAYRSRYRDFVRNHVLPYDTTPESFDEHENIRPDLLAILRAKAKEEGLWAPQMPRSRGGQGLPVAGMAACYEELNYSLFGPVAANCAAPDDGNMMLLEKVGTDAQKERWLQPIVDGTVRSAFAMTEPHPGSGSDPAMMR
ncbi:MAG TPA: acyl-CoA dehydrogenase family protein, partial [Usitatibacteraceae bacterium]|nr:acyl-CoA dehydrogenase family protein [Usitatibacteraceae bacterium]